MYPKTVAATTLTVGLHQQKINKKIDSYYYSGQTVDICEIYEISLKIQPGGKVIKDKVFCHVTGRALEMATSG